VELLLIRHALPVRREASDGPADPELSEAGQAQAKHLAAYLASEAIDAIYSSPLRRARETAAPLAEAFGQEVAVEPDVAELDRDASEYIPVEELRDTNDPRWQSMLDGSWMLQHEAPEAFAARVVDAVERIIAAHPGQRVAVVCHGGVIGRYTAHVLDLPGDRAGFFYPNYTSIHRIAASRNGPRSIVTLNETAHLRGTGLPMGLFQS
jgi:2,3-bisphosphoglycerate-dependent phosphoglycerate mutase